MMGAGSGFGSAQPQGFQGFQALNPELGSTQLKIFDFLLMFSKNMRNHLN